MTSFKLSIIILFILVGCSSKKEGEATTHEPSPEDKVVMTDEQIRNAGIEIGTAVVQRLNSKLKVNGRVDVPPQNIVFVSFPMGGYLRSTKLLPGMHVNRGEVIGIIEDQGIIQLQQDYLVAIARLNFLEKEYERQRLLNENNVNADKVFQQAQADFSSQKVLVKGYEEKLRLIGINPSKMEVNSISKSVPVTSPINGFVSKVNVNIGKYVTSTDVLFELINPSDMHAALTIFEKDLNKVRIGQKVSVSFVDDPSSVYECTVILVTKNVDESRSALAHCHFETQPKNLLPGMFLNASININSENALTLPEEAVVRYDNRQWVFESVSKNEFKMLEVQTGVTENGMLQVTSLLNDFEKKNFVKKNAYAVLSKMKNTAEEE